MTGLSRSKKVKEYRLITQDDLCTKKFGVGWLVNVQTRLANKMLNNSSKIDKPTLVLHGDSDIIALPEGAKRLMEHLKTQNKTLQAFAGADHWFFYALIPTASSKYSDEARQTVSKVVRDWLAR